MANEDTRYKTPAELTRPKIDAGNTLSLAIQIYLEQLRESVPSDNPTLHKVCEDLVKEFKYLEGELK